MGSTITTLTTAPASTSNSASTSISDLTYLFPSSLTHLHIQSRSAYDTQFNLATHLLLPPTLLKLELDCKIHHSFLLTRLKLPHSLEEMRVENYSNEEGEGGNEKEGEEGREREIVAWQSLILRMFQHVPSHCHPLCTSHIPPNSPPSQTDRSFPHLSHHFFLFRMATSSFHTHYASS